jgi:peptidoglycan/LPS O-acetylase OafA/YrhL
MQGKYIPQLDGIRALAILGVFFYHSPFHLKGGWIGVDLSSFYPDS